MDTRALLPSMKEGHNPHPVPSESCWRGLVLPYIPFLLPFVSKQLFNRVEAVLLQPRQRCWIIHCLFLCPRILTSPGSSTRWFPMPSAWRSCTRSWVTCSSGTFSLRWDQSSAVFIPLHLPIPWDWGTRKRQQLQLPAPLGQETTVGGSPWAKGASPTPGQWPTDSERCVCCLQHPREQVHNYVLHCGQAGQGKSCARGEIACSLDVSDWAVSWLFSS